MSTTRAIASLDEETAKKVIRQVEFYFGDSNLPRDKFLKNAISENQDGMVSLALICSFSRMRNHLGLGDMKLEDIKEDTVKAVAEALRTSSFVKISEDGKKVGRVTELQKIEEVIEQLDVRTISVSPFQYDVTLEDVESFFGQFAKVNSVRLPRHVADKRFFCGTALIEFSAEEDAAKMLGQSLTYAGVELEVKPKKDFDEERAKQMEESERFCSETASNSKNNSSSKDSYPKGLIIAFKLKSISSGGSAEQNGGQNPATDNVNVLKTVEEPDSKEKGPEDTEHNVQAEVKHVSNGENIDGSEAKVDVITCSKADGDETDGRKISSESPIQKDEQSPVEEKSTAALYKDNKDLVLREDLKDVFNKFGNVKFVDYSIGEDSGYIRFEDAAAAQKARAAAVLAAEGGVIVKNFIASLDPVSGEAERDYWSLLRSNQDNYRQSRNNRGRGGKHNRGGKQFFGKRPHSRDNASANRPRKFQKGQEV